MLNLICVYLYTIYKKIVPNNENVSFTTTTVLAPVFAAAVTSALDVDRDAANTAGDFAMPNVNTLNSKAEAINASDNSVSALPNIGEQDRLTVWKEKQEASKQRLQMMLRHDAPPPLDISKLDVDTMVKKYYENVSKVDEVMPTSSASAYELHYSRETDNTMQNAALVSKYVLNETSSSFVIENKATKQPKSLRYQTNLLLHISMYKPLFIASEYLCSSAPMAHGSLAKRRLAFAGNTSNLPNQDDTFKMPYDVKRTEANNENVQSQRNLQSGIPQQKIAKLSEPDYEKVSKTYHFFAFIIISLIYYRKH